MNPEVEEHDHEADRARLEHRIATGYAAGTLAAYDHKHAVEQAEEAYFERVTGRCRSCASTTHPSSVCGRHRAMFDIPE